MNANVVSSPGNHSLHLRGHSALLKKVSDFPLPQPGCHWPNSPWAGIIKIFLARKSLVSDIRAGDGKIVNLFLQCAQIRDRSTQLRGLSAQIRGHSAQIRGHSAPIWGHSAQIRGHSAPIWWRGLERCRRRPLQIFSKTDDFALKVDKEDVPLVEKNIHELCACSSITATCCTELQNGDQLPKWWKVTMNHSLSTPLISQLMDSRSVTRGWSQILSLFRPWREVTVIPGPLYWAKEKRHSLTVCVHCKWRTSENPI